jgi:hypothetical protein
MPAQNGGDPVRVRALRRLGDSLIMKAEANREGLRPSGFRTSTDGLPADHRRPRLLRLGVFGIGRRKD